MRLQIYVPVNAAQMWDPAPGFITWERFLQRVTEAAGGVTVLTGTGHWNGKHGHAIEPVYVVEALVQTNFTATTTYANTWALLREYARQLLAQGEESVLIVQDNEPTLIS